MDFQVKKVNSLPGELEANTLYLVSLDTDSFGIVVTNDAGTQAKAVAADGLPPEAADITDSTVIGRTILTAADAAAVLAALGAATLNSPTFNGPVTIDDELVADGSPGTVGQVLTSQGANNPAIWADQTPGGSSDLTAESIFYANIFGA